MKNILNFVILICIICLGNSALAQGRYEISGTVTDEAGKPVSGATVSLSKVEKITAADDNGRFIFKEIAPGDFTLTVTAIGHKSSIQKVKVKDGSVTATAILNTEANALNEVAVNAKKEHYGIKTVTGEEAEKLSAAIRNITDPNIYDRQGNVVAPAKAAEMEKSFEYHVSAGQTPGKTGFRHLIARVDPETEERVYQTVNNIPLLKVKSPKLQEGVMLKLKPIAKRVDTNKLVGKAIVMIFWRPAHAGEPITDQYHEINRAIAPFANSDKLQVIAITHLGFPAAVDELKYNPILNAQMVTNGSNITDDYGTGEEPVLIMTDTSHKIILSSTRHVFETAWMLHKLLQDNLN